MSSRKCPECVDGYRRRRLREARFNLFHALGTWDDAHRRAFLTWVDTPFWP